MVLGGGGRRVRRNTSYTNGGTTSVLPIRSPRPHHYRPSFSNTISCWYCDLKISAFNNFLFAFGRKHARFLRIWFSIGTGFGVTALLGVTLILVGELAATLKLANLNVNTQFQNFYRTILFGFQPSTSVSGLTLSLTDCGYIVVSTLISVAVHEFGHAIAAASEGVQIEYIAIYIAVLFPGALIAFNYDSLQTLPQFTALRVYCAGIWHNAVCCAACALALFLLPSILYPFYLHAENLMVLDVASTSPLSSYLSPGDMIESVDGLKIHDPNEWMEKTTLLDQQSFHDSRYSNDSESSQAITGLKGYCIPTAWMEDEDHSSCPDGLTAFSSVPCFGSSAMDEGRRDVYEDTRKGMQCFNAGDVVQLKKCGKGWLVNGTSGSNCLCSQNEACLMPILARGLSWVEITYKRPYSSDCLLLERNSSSVLETPVATKCGGTFVFIGDLASIASSVQLTAYQPRWALKMAWNLPNFLQKLLACTFYVSLTLSLLNSLPVFLLDGESILEMTIGCIFFLSSKKRAIVLKACLFGGTLLSILAFSRVFFSFL